VKELEVTFIGHATVLVELGGRFFLTDPVFSPRIHTRKRQARPGLGVEDLPPLTAVLISHAHFDHFDLPSLRRLAPEVPIVVPPGTRGLARSLGERRFVELAAWKQWDAPPGVRITAVPADHFGGRVLLDSFLRPAGGYVIEAGGRALYFAGDTAPGNPFREIGGRFALDLALLPIGAYRPRWIMRWSHQDPYQALDAFRALGAEFLVPIHWGTFRLSLEPMDEPVRLLKEAAAEQGIAGRVIVLEPGESWELPASGQAATAAR
jgi:L-ascorbate metabolism protein UlaG (beta-lactamase superfamily)